MEKSDWSGKKKNCVWWNLPNQIVCISLTKFRGVLKTSVGRERKYYAAGISRRGFVDKAEGCSRTNELPLTNKQGRKTSVSPRLLVQRRRIPSHEIFWRIQRNCPRWPRALAQSCGCGPWLLQRRQQTVFTHNGQHMSIAQSGYRI